MPRLPTSVRRTARSTTTRLLAGAACAVAVLFTACTGRGAEKPKQEPAAAAGTPRPSPPVVDGAFLNTGFDKKPGDVLRFYFQKLRAPSLWEYRLDTPPGPKPPERVGDGALRVTVVNHATVLLQYDGLNVLTDPIWSERASPVSFAGPRRHVPPGLRFEDLPPIDVVAISHDHYDHLDLPTLKRLEAAFHPLFLVGLKQAPLLREAGIKRVTELGWLSTVTLASGQQVWGQESQHWTGRGITGRNRTLWLSYVFGTRGGPVYFAGDTGYSPHFAATGQRFGPMRLALLPIGAHEPRWFMKFQHANPCEAAQAHRDLGAALSVAMHYGTFELATESQDGPKEELAQCLAAAGIAGERFRALPFGTGLEVPALAIGAVGIAATPASAAPSAAPSPATAAGAPPPSQPVAATPAP